MSEHEPEQAPEQAPDVVAPLFPTEHVLNTSQAFFQRLLGEGMQIKFVAVIVTPRGPLPAPEATVINFTKEGWERFKQAVEADGVLPPAIETAIHIPGGLLNGEPR